MNLAFSLFSPAFVLPDDEAKCLFVIARGALVSAFYLPEAKERFVSKKKKKKAGSGSKHKNNASCI